MTKKKEDRLSIFIATHITESDDEALTAAVIEERRAKAWIIREALRHYLKKYRPERSISHP